VAEIGDYKYDIAEHPMGVITTIKIITYPVVG
jgi:hypothetical protein